MKRVLSFLCAFVMVLACAGVTTTKAETPYTTGGTPLYEGQVVSFKNVGHEKFMNVQHGSASSGNGTKLNLYPWDNTNTMKFKVHLNNDDSITLSPLCTPNKYVDIRRYGNPITDNQDMVIWGADGDAHKNIHMRLWGDVGVELLFAAHPDYCISSRTNGTLQTKKRSSLHIGAISIEELWVVCDANGNKLDLRPTMQNDIWEPFEKWTFRLSLAEAIAVCKKEAGSCGENAKAWVRNTYGLTVEKYGVAYVNYVLSRAGIKLPNLDKVNSSGGAPLLYVPALRE